MRHRDHTSVVEAATRREFLHCSAVALVGTLGAARETSSQPVAAPLSNLHEWSHYKGNAGFTGVSPDSSVKPPLKLLWSYRLDGDATNDAGGGPIVGGEKLFLPVVNTRSVIALDAGTGRFVWQYDGYTSGQRKVPTYHNGRLFLWERPIYGKKAAVLALDAGTGKLLWQQPLAFEGSDPHKAGLPVDDGKVYCSEGGAEPSVKAFDAKTGQLVWQTPLGKDDGLCVVCPAAAGGRVFVGTRTTFALQKSPDGATLALDAASGKILWRRRNIVPLTALASDGQVVACTAHRTTDERFHFLDAASGESLWSAPRPSLPYNPATILPDRVLIKPYGSDFYALDRKTGKQLYQFTGHGRSGCCTPSVSGSHAYIGTGVPPPTGDLEALDAFQLVHAPREKGLGGTLYAVDLKTGKPEWRFGTGNTICGEPAIAYGRLYFAGRDGRVYCFAPAREGEPTVPEARDRSEPAPSADVEALRATKFADSPRPGRDWPMQGGGQARTNVQALPLKPPLELAWKLATGDRIYTSAAVRDGRVFVASDSGRLIAADVQTGKPIWEFQAGAALRCSPAAASDLIYCGCDDGKLHALDARSGKPRWSFAAGGPVQAAPALAGGIVVFAANDHNVYALDRFSGKKLWNFRGNDYAFQAPPVIQGDRVFAAQWTDWLWCLDLKTGTQLWRTFIPVTIEAVAHYRDKLYARAPNHVVEIDPQTGKRLRIGSASYGYGGIAFAHNLLFLSGVRGEHGTTGATATDLDDPGKELTRKIPTLEGVRLLQPKGLKDFPELAAMGAPLVIGDRVCFASLAGKVVLTEKDGTKLWTHQLGGSCHSPPVAADGLLIVGCDDGQVYAFREKSDD